MTEMTITTLKQRKGSYHKLHEEFDSYFHWLVQTLSQKYELTGDRDALHVGSWPSPAQLKTMDIYQIRWIKPEELFEPYNEYIKTRGDPQTNGLGHTVQPGPGGMQMVKVWTSDSWKKEVSLIK